MVPVLEIGRWKKQYPFIFWAVAFSVGLVVFFWAFYLYVAYLLPLPDPFAQASIHPTTKIYDRHGLLLYEVLQPESGQKSFVPLKQIPQSFIDATLAAEDINFYSHPGVDVVAIGRALFFNIQQQRIVSGASTITQQLVRNLLGIRNRDIWDKGLEALYAIRLSHVYSKDEILELYLNTIYYGNLAYGAQSAAQNYFSKHIYDLDLAQMTFLAGLPQSPSRYDPYVSFAEAKKRQRYVLDQMVKHGFLASEEADEAFNEPLHLAADAHPIKAPHFVHYVLNGLEETYGEDMVHRGGLRVTTTLDYNLQLQAEAIIRRHLELLSRHNVQSAALIALDVETGQVLTWVGSANYFDEEIDGAVDISTSLRQPGSSIKPLTYLLAFEKGYNPATVIFDIPTQFSTATGPYTPKNYDLEFHGPVRVRTALASSYNVPAVKTLEFVGVGSLLSFLSDLGIQTLDESAAHYGLSLTLGGGEVRLIDMARAYHVLASYGSKIDPSPILEIQGPGGELLYTWQQPRAQYVLGEYGRENAYLIIDILKDPDARIPGFGEGSVLEISHEAAVKTGTTRNFRDNWTIGFTPRLLTAVWVGNADASPMENISGVSGAAPVWADFMEAALAASPKESFEVPAGIVEAEICALSGKLPTQYCAERVYERFHRGNVPAEYDDYHQLFTLNTQNGHIVHLACADDYPSLVLAEKVLVAYPSELQKWAAEKGLSLPPSEPCATPSAYPDDSPNGYPNDQVDGLFIHHPANNDEFILDYSLPAEDQKVPLRVSAPHNTLEVTFFIDDEPVGSQREIPYTLLWLPTKGEHSFRAEALLNNGETLTSPSVRFSVL